MITVIINPISGGAPLGVARTRAELASTVLSSFGEAAEIFVTERKGHARDLAHGAINRGARLVIAWGGDGTMNEVASALAFGQTPLALVPAGSGNGLARELGINRRPERAIADAIGATARTIDAGELGGRLFFNIAGVGFDAHVAACLDRDTSGPRGFGAYARIVARELWAYRSAAYRIDGRVTGRRVLLVTLANSSQFGNGARIAPAARLDDGRLDLVLFEESSRLSTVLAVPRLFTGGLSELRGAATRQIERIAIESGSEGPMTFHVDGEPVQGGPRLEGRVHPQALRVCVR